MSNYQNIKSYNFYIFFTELYDYFLYYNEYDDKNHMHISHRSIFTKNKKIEINQVSRGKKTVMIWTEN